MSTKGFLAPMLLIPMLWAACSPARPLPTPLAALTDNWTVKLTQSGGFVGVLLTLEVSSDGGLKAQDGRAGKSVERMVSPETLSQLTALIAGLQIAPDAGTYPGCADCFIYELEIQSGGSVSKTRVDDITIGKSGIEELVTLLRGLRNDALGISY